MMPGTRIQMMPGSGDGPMGNVEPRIKATEPVFAANKLMVYWVSPVVWTKACRDG
ncbi:hypothetical protein [Novipirellula maiorica]|nr:hypothetical protein [Rhodopirellula maiorica]